MIGSMKKIWIALCFCSTFSFVHGQTISSSDNELVEKIRQANVSHTAFSSKFKQTKHIVILGKDILSSGMFYYKKPDRLALRYDNPAGDLLLINGDQCVMVSAGKRSEVSAKANAKVNGLKTILSACLQGDIKQTGASRITCKETSRYYIITAEMDTKTNKSTISKLVLHFEKADLTLSILRTEEPDGSYTTYELLTKEFDKPISENLFLAPKK
jgi:outer membrane lipoprotein-sorting protein